MESTQQITTPPAPALTPAPDGKVGILPALHAVMAEIKAVGKEGWNSFSKYNFRGIDGVMNAVGPALRKHDVLLLPTVEDIVFGTTPAKGGAVMTTVRLRMRVQMMGMDGSSLAAVVWGEAFDSGDKATAKAHSVALRTALIQMLALPTQEPDPDEQTYERRAASMSDDDILRDAEQCSSIDLASMVRQAQNAGNRALYEALIQVGKRRFPPRPANGNNEQGEA